MTQTSVMAPLRRDTEWSDHRTQIAEKPTFTNDCLPGPTEAKWNSNGMLSSRISCPILEAEENSWRNEVTAAKQAGKKKAQEQIWHNYLDQCLLANEIYIPCCLYQEPEVKYWPLWSWWQISHNQNFILVLFCRLFCDLWYVNSKGKLKCSESGKIFYRAR